MVVCTNWLKHVYSVTYIIYDVRLKHVELNITNSRPRCLRDLIVTYIEYWRSILFGNYFTKGCTFHHKNKQTIILGTIIPGMQTANLHKWRYNVIRMHYAQLYDAVTNSMYDAVTIPGGVKLTRQFFKTNRNIERQRLSMVISIVLCAKRWNAGYVFLNT